MTAPTLEHINLTVVDLDVATRFILTALPEWRVRGGGTMDWFGKSIRWRHVGDDQQYIALQGGGEGEGLNWRSHAVGVKHVGVVVPWVEDVVERLERAGFALDHWGGEGTARRSAYVYCDRDLQFEFVAYTSDEPILRNAYN